jgi:endonuclease/exonuclease/phosphatase (EEP) superfamily protein YafD
LKNGEFSRLEKNSVRRKKKLIIKNQKTKNRKQKTEIRLKEEDIIK